MTNRDNVTPNNAIEMLMARAEKSAMRRASYMKERHSERKSVADALGLPIDHLARRGVQYHD